MTNKNKKIEEFLSEANRNNKVTAQSSAKLSVDVMFFFDSQH
ncbi:15692_t:CDS:1, partial [Cetraspora pellucida]